MAGPQVRERSGVGESQDAAPSLVKVIEQLKESRTDWKNPLDQEIEYVVSDARGALDFIASNFLPSSMLAEVEADAFLEGDV